MENKNIKMIVANQPIPESLKKYLPINFFMLTKVNTTNKKDETKLVKSDFHNTNKYVINSFYKSISNVL
jgi:hypothetical protein